VYHTIFIHIFQGEFCFCTKIEIDDCSKIIPFLINSNNYTFLPEDMAEPFVTDKKLQIIPLLDLQTPMINSYIIGSTTKRELWEHIFIKRR